MPKPIHPRKHKLKIAFVSLLGILIPSACAPQPTCYTPAVPPTSTPEPTLPFVTCYSPLASPTPADSPLSPLPTPTPPDSPLETPTPTPTAEARRRLRDDLLARRRFPESTAREMES